MSCLIRLSSRASAVGVLRPTLSASIRRCMGSQSIAASVPTLVAPNLNWSGSLEDFKPLVLFEDNHVIAVYKPATVLAQGDTKGNDNILDAVKRYLKKQLGSEGDAFTGLLHRMDRTTSGVVVLARTSTCASRLSAQFRERKVAKHYLAVVNGELHSDAGRLTDMVQTAINKTTVVDAEEIKSKSNGSGKGKGKKKGKGADNCRVVSAVLRYRTLHRLQLQLEQRVADAPVPQLRQTLVSVELETGRKHQIRAQLSHLGHPIVGDVKYGATQRFHTRDISLHTAVLAFAHPVTGERIVISAQVPGSWHRRFGPELIAASASFIEATEKDIRAKGAEEASSGSGD